MDPNTHSTQSVDSGPLEPLDDGLAALTADVDALAVQDLAQLSATVRTQRLLAWRRLLDRQEGLWLQELAALDAGGAGGADQGQELRSTAAWLRDRLRMSAGVARGSVRTARALFGGSLPETAAALCAGDISPAHAQVVADGTSDLPDHVKLAAEPVLVETARRVDPPRLRQAVAQLCQVADPDGADRAAARRHERRGLWLSPTWQGMVAIGGLLDPEAGTTCWRPWSRWPARPTPTMRAPGASGERMGWRSWPAGRWRVGGCPRPVGSGPSCWSPWSWTACWDARAGWMGRRGGPGHWPPRRAGDWPATGR
jgi:hypothetical protein